jgi:hypothetical protein
MEKNKFRYLTAVNKNHKILLVLRIGLVLVYPKSLGYRKYQGLHKNIQDKNIFVGIRNDVII